MSIKILEDMRSLIRHEDIFYISYGKLNQNILQSLIATTGNSIYDHQNSKEYSKESVANFIAVAIEMIQNVSKYGEKIENHNGDLVLVTTNNNIQISTSNLINEDDKEKITKSIDFLNSLDKKELRKYARETMKKARMKDKNSAGLGLIEIARLSKEGIKYNFNQHKQDSNLFYFNITIDICKE
jgi:hypothetical protein